MEQKPLWIVIVSCAVSTLLTGRRHHPLALQLQLFLYNFSITCFSIHEPSTVGATMTKELAVGG